VSSAPGDHERPLQRASGILVALLTARKCDELLDQTATFARAVKASLAGDGGGVSGADADVQAFLRLLRTLETVFQKRQEPAGLKEFLAAAHLPEVWTELDSTLLRLFPGEKDAKLSGGGGKEPHASAPALNRLLPLIEAFFLLHDAQSTELSTFCEKHTVALNEAVRQSRALLTTSLAPLVNNFPQCLDFDNKRHHFRQRLKALRGDLRYESIRIHVRRQEVFMDSYHQLRMRSGEEMKGKMTVQFVGEEGVDAGGVTREWFGILAREIFNPMYGLFQPAGGKQSTFHPNPMSYVNPDHLSFFTFIGRIVGKALYDNVTLEAYFTRSFYKHMLKKPVSSADMEALDPEFYKNLQWMLDNSVEGVLDLTFSVEADEFGRVKVIPLKPGGSSIPVTDENKLEYVQLLCEHHMSHGIQQQLKAFLQGFHELVPPELITPFDANELELLISGLPEIDIEDLKRNTDYSGYTETTPVIRWFWKCLGDMTQEQKAWFLQFVTGTSQVPLEGFKGLVGMRGPQKFSIHKAYGEDRLPTAHTCFNQLDLPDYPSEEVLQKKLLQAICEAHEGFGFV